MNNNVFIDKEAEKFLMRSGVKPILEKFHRDGDNIIASNAHILIISPDKYFEDWHEPQKEYVKYREVIPPHSSNVVAKISVKKFIRRYEALPKEVVFQECEECEGNGYRVCDLGHKHDCDNCNDGETSKAIGEEVNIEEYIGEISDTFYNLDYLYCCVNIANKLNLETLDIHYLERGKPVVLYANDIMMLLMPMLLDRVDIEQEIIQIPTVANG